MTLFTPQRRQKKFTVLNTTKYTQNCVPSGLENHEYSAELKLVLYNRIQHSASVKVALQLRGLAWNFPSVSPVVDGKISSHSHELLWVSDSKINLLVWFLLPWLSHSEKFWHQWLIPNTVFFSGFVTWFDHLNLSQKDNYIWKLLILMSCEINIKDSF